MDLLEATSLLNKFAPSNLHDISKLITGIHHELINTKKYLEKELIERQKSSDYKSLHEIISLQEILSEYIKMTSKFNSHCKRNDMPKKQTIQKTIKIEKEHGQIVDTDWYTIDENDVTYKNLHALAFRQRNFTVTKWTSCYITICNLLYKQNPAIIERMLYHKETGIKISNQPKKLFAPKKIEGSQLWLEVHGNAVSLRKAILHLLDLYHVPYSDVKVLYSDKHANDRV